MASKTSAAYYTTSKDKKPTCDHCQKSHLSAECWKEYPHLNPFLKKEKAREEEKRKQVRKAAKEKQYDSDSDSDEGSIVTSRSSKKSSSRTTSKSKGWQVKTVSNIAKSVAKVASSSNSGPSDRVANAIMRILGFKGMPTQLQTNDDLQLTSEEMKEYISFCIDAGATDNYANSELHISNIDRSNPSVVETASGQKLTSIGKGNIPGKLDEVIIMPEFTDNLLSEMQLYEKGYTIIKGKRTGVLILNSDGELVAQGYLHEGLFRVNIKVSKEKAMQVQQGDEEVREAFKRVAEKKNEMGLTPTVIAAIEKWYSRLGHIGAGRTYDTLQHSTGHDVPNWVTLAQFKSIVKDYIIFVATQSTEKAHRNLKYSHSQTATPTDSVPYHTLHIDIKTMDKVSRNGHKYVMIVTDETTGTKTPLFLATKSSEEVVEELESFINAMSIKIKLGLLKVRSKTLFRADNGGEQKSKVMADFLERHDAKIEFSDPYNSESNGRSERSIRTVENTARGVKMTADMKQSDWDMCFANASVLDRYHSTRANPDKISPYQALHKTEPDISFLKRLGCIAYVHNSKPSRKASADVGRNLLGIQCLTGQSISLALRMEVKTKP